ncbi:hypothetical protein EVAR_102891_1 [Eumeta japonica]|uniref:Uncharacterized protein n=1 Tax=Eumeta variegata TaxID=151549 RepID=A0A4C1UNT1_EUMVA|nr:hypothetical protein EVAR_102891_1 [Eumeta japonica]
MKLEMETMQTLVNLRACAIGSAIVQANCWPQARPKSCGQSSSFDMTRLFEPMDQLHPTEGIDSGPRLNQGRIIVEVQSIGFLFGCSIKAETQPGASTPS